MGMGMLCNCGDTATGGSSTGSSSRPIAPLTQDCARCKGSCFSPAIKLPQFVFVETSLLNDGQFCRNITSGSFEVWDCNCDFRLGAILSLLNGGTFRLDAVSSSCLYVSDCYLLTNCEVVNTSTQCVTSGCGFTKQIIDAASRPNAISTQNLYYLTLQFPSSGCSNPEFSYRFKTSEADGSAGVCPTSKSAGPYTASFITNEIFSCDPFFYQANMWFQNLPGGPCCVSTARTPPGQFPPVCAACCQFAPGGGWYNGIKVTIS